MISRPIIKGEVSVISRSQRLRPITLTETLIILDNTKNRIQSLFHYPPDYTAVKNTVPQKVFKSCANRVFYSGFEAFFSLKHSWNTCLFFVDFSVFSASLSSTNIVVSLSINRAIRAIVYRSLSASYSTGLTT